MKVPARLTQLPPTEKLDSGRHVLLARELQTYQKITRLSHLAAG